MESNDGRYGWAADDPRWSDALAGGRGRLEPSPPRFGATDAPPTDTPLSETPLSETPLSDTPLAHTQPADVAAPESSTPGGPASLRPAGLPQWPPPAPTAPGGAPEPPPAAPRPELPTPQAIRDLLGPPLAIGAAPTLPPPAPPPPAPLAGPPPGSVVGAAPVPSPVPTSPVPTSVPLRVHTPLASAAEVELRTGYGLSSAVTGRAGGELATRPRTTRLERRVRIRSRWSTEDEFRRAARIELFSDDARYRVLFALTAAWYGPAALVYLAWVLLVRDSAGGADVVAGLLWLAAASVVSLAVAGLLRWASIGWRALTLSAAAAIIGGGITTIAQTLTS